MRIVIVKNTGKIISDVYIEGRNLPDMKEYIRCIEWLGTGLQAGDERLHIEVYGVCRDDRVKALTQRLKELTDDVQIKDKPDSACQKYAPGTPYTEAELLNIELECDFNSYDEEDLAGRKSELEKEFQEVCEAIERGYPEKCVIDTGINLVNKAIIKRSIAKLERQISDTEKRRESISERIRKAQAVMLDELN